MKKILLPVAIALALTSFVNLLAQAPPAYPIHLSDSPSAAAGILPYTTIKVYLTVEKESVQAGPYARYAQRFLGVMPALADRQTNRIVSARLDYSDPDRTLEPVAVEKPAAKHVLSHVFDSGGFAKSNPDRVSAVDKSTEEMAREAANTIFALRRQRLDILTGEAGELYAGGLEAAFSEISRIEDEYLALFLGKQSVETLIYEFDVTPQSDRLNYIVCRFTEQDGLLPDSDLSGQPVVLAFSPEKGVATETAGKVGKQTIQYRVADFAEGKLTYGQTELAKKRIPVYQFGANITAPAR